MAGRAESAVELSLPWKLPPANAQLLKECACGQLEVETEQGALPGPTSWYLQDVKMRTCH